MVERGREASWDDGDGVTAAVGTALMVVVMVVMSVGLSIAWKHYVAEEVDDHTPPVGFYPDEASDTATVVRHSGELDWFLHVSFAGTCSPTLNGELYPTEAGPLVEEGDRLGCAPGETLVVVINDTVLYRYEFR